MHNVILPKKKIENKMKLQFPKESNKDENSMFSNIKSKSKA